MIWYVLVTSMAHLNKAKLNRLGPHMYKLVALPFAKTTHSASFNFQFGAYHISLFSENTIIQTLWTHPLHWQFHHSILPSLAVIVPGIDVLS